MAAVGKSQKQAEQAAAHNALEALVSEIDLAVLKITKYLQIVSRVSQSDHSNCS